MAEGRYKKKLTLERGFSYLKLLTCTRKTLLQDEAVTQRQLGPITSLPITRAYRQSIEREYAHSAYFSYQMQLAYQ